MSEYKCLESINSLFVEHTELGYSTIPCCLYKGRDKQEFVPNISDLMDNPTSNAIRERFKGDWKRPECIDCIMNESMDKKSKRLRSLKRGNKDGVVRWDIRPGNTCNLKCVMCNPWNSSKWYEDVDVFKKYSTNIINEANSRPRENIDWNYIYEHSIDKAEFIYIAGGEPFYMKSCQEFLDKLSQHEWNRKNTEIQIQTNGVSNTDKFLEILKRFKRLSFSISIDGWGSVNELIRYPTKQKTLEAHTKQLIDLNCMYLFFNITVQALNLPNIDKLTRKIKEHWNGRYDIHKLTVPKHLAVNCLKPRVVEQVLDTTEVPELKTFYKDYAFDQDRNIQMKNFLRDLDRKRGTDSRKVVPWCFK